MWAKLFSPRWIGCALAALVLAFVVVTSQCERVRRPRALDDVKADGSFVEYGPVPHGRPAPAGLRYWSSWAGDESLRGSLTLGPFQMPRRLGLLVSGYPRIGNNAIHVENLDTGDVHIQHTDNIGEGWCLVRLNTPEAWHGDRIVIRVIDDSEGWGAWIAASEPVAWPWWTDWAHGFTPRLAGLVAAMLVTALLVGGAARLLVSTRWVPVSSVYLVPLAVGCVATAGFLLFWVGLFSTRALNTVAWLMLVGATLASLAPLLHDPGSMRRADTSSPSGGSSENPQATVWSQEWFLVAVVTALCALFVFSMLHLFASSGLLSEVARARFSSDTLPSDNSIPQMFAERIRAGALQIYASPGDGTSSDRPPLQIGWVLALVPLSLLLGIDYDTAAQCAGICLQCLAIPTIWALLRSLGTSRTASAAIIFAVVPSGFFFIHLTFVWPKMAAGAFAVLAFLFWFGNKQTRIGVKHPYLMAGVLAGLAWLSHGGIGFAFLALAPVVVWSCLRGNWRRWMISAAGSLMFALPWSAYQKFYDPPGNRLLKWHLAGVIPPDERGTFETFVTAYRGRSFAQFRETQRLNWEAVYEGPWSDLASFSFTRAAVRRTYEFFHTLFALGWWNLGWLFLPLAMALRRWPDSARSGITRLVAWSLGTTCVWVLLIFIGGQSSIHQGPYSILLVLFPILALGVLRLHVLLFAAAVAAQAAIFLNVWMTPPCVALGQSWQSGPMATMACVLMAGSSLLVAMARRQAKKTESLIYDPTAAGS